MYVLNALATSLEKPRNHRCFLSSSVMSSLEVAVILKYFDLEGDVRISGSSLAADQRKQSIRIPCAFLGGRFIYIKSTLKL